MTQRHFHGKEEYAMQLRVNGPDGTAWRMKYYIMDVPQCQVRICVGWREFVEGYHLQDGDVCLFELYNVEEMAFNVKIFPVYGKKKAKKVEEPDYERF